MKEKPHKELQSNEERSDIMKSLDARLDGPFHFDKDFEDFPIPKELQDARIRQLNPDIEENSKKILQDLKHKHSRKTL